MLNIPLDLREMWLCARIRRERPSVAEESAPKLNMKTSFAETEGITETELLESEVPNEADLLESEVLGPSEGKSTSNEETQLAAGGEHKTSTFGGEHKTSPVEGELKPQTKPVEGELKPQTKPVEGELKPQTKPVEGAKPKALVEKLAIIGSGLAGYSALLAACSEQTTPLLITGPTLGGTLASAGSLEY